MYVCNRTRKWSVCRPDPPERPRASHLSLSHNASTTTPLQDLGSSGVGGGAVVRRSGPYLELRIRVCRAAWGIDAIGVDKHRPRSESEKSTWKSTTFFHVPQRRLSQDTGMQHCDRKRLAGRTASHRTARAQTSERLPRNPRPAY